jgi:O-antigen ligase
MREADMPTHRWWAGLNALWGFAFVSLLIVVAWGYALVPLLAGTTLIVGLILAPRPAAWRVAWGRDDTLMCLVLLGYGGLWLLDVLRSGYWPVGEGGQGRLLPLWPVLAAALLVWLRCFPPSPRVLWWAAGCGALGAGAIALYERVVLGHARASNGMNAIPFGNLALLLGGLSLLAALWCLRRGEARRRWLLGLALVAAVAGGCGSLLSGTRGGWVALPLLLLLVYRAARPLLPKRYTLAPAVALLLILIGVASHPQSGVSARLGMAVGEVQEYWKGGARETSVGLRFEMWRTAWLLFRERPLVGWGEGGVVQGRDALVARGEVHADVARFEQLHSDLFDTAARRGLVGLAALLLLYGMPLWLFWRRLPGQDVEPGVQVLAAAGMMIPVAFIDFGLTQTMLRDPRGLSGYLGLCVLYWVALRHQEARLLDRR